MNMRNFLKYLSIVITALAFASCEKPAEEPKEPVLDVTPTNIKGTWQLSEWNGEPLPEGRYFYIEFITRDRLFKSYENTSSSRPHKETGYYTITVDESIGASIIRGMLDNSMGREWNNRYIVTDLTSKRMVWTVTDNPEDISVFERVDSIPVEITGEPAE